jgi:hypothetical protein
VRELTDEVAVDRPDVLAQVRAVFDRYERALVDGDLEVLDQLIWDDDRTVRFGVADRQHGAVEIAAWRAKYPSVPPGRHLHQTTVLAVDDRTAVVSTLFDYPGGVGSQPAAGPVEGRQTQIWVRFAEGWRIVAAHVSEVTLS